MNMHCVCAPVLRRLLKRSAAAGSCDFGGHATGLGKQDAAVRAVDALASCQGVQDAVGRRHNVRVVDVQSQQDLVALEEYQKGVGDLLEREAA